MDELKRKSKSAGIICEKHRIILRTIDTKTQIGTNKRTNKNRRRKPQMDKKKDNEDHQRNLEIGKK
jgi:hypothetical protein